MSVQSYDLDDGVAGKSDEELDALMRKEFGGDGAAPAAKQQGKPLEQMSDDELNAQLKAEYAAGGAKAAPARAARAEIPLPNKIETGLRSGLSGYSLGLTEAPISMMNAVVGKAIDASDVANNPKNEFTLQNIVDSYDKDVARRRDLKKQLPAIDAGAGLAGAIAPGGATGMLVNSIARAGKGVVGLAPAAQEAIAAPGLASAMARVAGKGALGGAATAADMGIRNVTESATGFTDPASPGQVKDAAQTGALLTAMLSSIPETRPYAGAIADKLKGYSEEKAVKAVGAILADFKEKVKTGTVGDFGRFLLDQGIVSPLAGAKKMLSRATEGADRSEAAVDGLVAKYAGALDDPETIKGLSPENQSLIYKALYRPLAESKKLAADFTTKYGAENSSKLGPAMEEFGELGNQGRFSSRDEIVGTIKGMDDKIQALKDQGLGKKEIRDIIAQEADRLEQIGKPYSITETMDQKRRMNNLIKDTAYSKTGADNPVRTAAQLARQESLRGGVENISNAAAQIMGDNPDQVRNLNQNWSRFLDAKGILQDKVAREASNRAFSLTDTIASGSAATVGAGASSMIGAGPVPGALIGGFAGGLTNKIARTYGPQIAATTANTAYKLLNTNPDSLGKYAPVLTEAMKGGTVHFLSTLERLSSDNEFQGQVKKAESDSAPATKVPPEFMGAVSSAIPRLKGTSVTEKAKAMDRLNRYGEVKTDDLNRYMDKISPPVQPNDVSGGD